MMPDSIKSMVFFSFQYTHFTSDVSKYCRVCYQRTQSAASKYRRRL